MLLGHRFIVPARVDSAIVSTDFGIAWDFGLVSFGASDARTHDLYRASVAGLAQTIDLSLRLHPRFALVAAVTGAVETGVTADSALNQGAEGGVTWRVGAAGVLARLERVGTQVGARLVVEGQIGGFLPSLEKLFDSAVSTRMVPPPSALFDARSSTDVRFSWSAAQAIGRHFSVQSAFGWVATESALAPPRTEHEVDLTAGIALTADGAPRVPVAIQLEYAADVVISQSAQPGGDPAAGPAYLLADSGTHAFVAGLYYSGRPDLQLGVIGGGAIHVDLPPRTSALGRLELRYRF